jgi:hypothetical protein
MSASTRPSIECLVTPAHVWAGLSRDQRTQVIAALAHLAVHWLTAQPVPQPMPGWKEAQDVPWLDPSQNSARAS